MVKDALGGFVDNDRLEIVINDDYAEGMSTSLRAGLEAARGDDYDAVVFLLGDMPMIDAGMLDSMIARYRSSDRPLCYVRAKGHAGHPIIVRKDHFDAFMNIEGDIGGREIVRRNLESALEIDMDVEGIDHQLDINKAEDMKTYLSLCRGRNAS
jgi:molybdenum cofactor cytidylyltransferase